MVDEVDGNRECASMYDNVLCSGRWGACAAGLPSGGWVGVVCPHCARMAAFCCSAPVARAQEAGGTKDGHCNLADSTYPQGWSKIVLDKHGDIHLTLAFDLTLAVRT